MQFKKDELTREELILSEHFLLGPSNDWLTLTMFMLDGSDAMLATAGVIPDLMHQTPTAYLSILRCRLVNLIDAIDTEFKCRENDDPSKFPYREADLTPALEQHSQQIRRLATVRAVAWISGVSEDQLNRIPTTEETTE